MDNRAEVRDFLTSRRARLTPGQAGLPAHGGGRRVKGLRREEVALLAGVSVDYYTRLERGSLGGVSESVLEALARALQLDEAENAYLHDLARAATARAPRTRKRRAEGVRPGVQAMLDAMTEAPALVRNGRLDILATNRLGRALYCDLFRDPVRPANHARFAFLDERARDLWVDWDRAANDTVGILRAEAGRRPYDRALTDLVGELSTRSEDFRQMWAAHEVRLHQTGTKTLHHPVVGRLELLYETLDLQADEDLTMLVYAAAPGTSTEDALRLLASWAATLSDDAVGATAAE
ncbi:helix-turn-helix transcriptional regulator [Pseudokineococcus basanitobsidens]|uniref:Helix-turn-helix transcriptional regulator n=1 Tax=Pseudokineococcus basanitobsidens TaxID=1926649 RepID=A0ABU8RPB1_9ACTN